MKISKLINRREIQAKGRGIPKIILTISKLAQFLIVYIFTSNLVLVIMGEKPVVAEFFSIGSGAYMVFLLCWCFILFILIEIFIHGVRFARNLSLALLLFHIYICFRSFIFDRSGVSEISASFSFFQVLIECVLIILILLPSCRIWFCRKR